MVKLLDYDLEELAQNQNPLAAIVQAHRISQIANQDAAVGYANKLSLIKSLYERGFSRENIVELFRIIDWLIALPELEEERLWQEIQTLEENKNMPYVTSVERIGIKKGRVKGLQQGKQQDIVRILEFRFEGVTEELKLLIGKLDNIELLGDLILQAVTTPSLDEFTSIVSQHVVDDKSEKSN
ncbi:MAG: hypothetical protein F6K47_02190 [Symploca sp. SIO2E6]|nr:hypothetical protein [Symploca sp. SIO2E6]